jgi:hypothetical protein
MLSVVLLFIGCKKTDLDVKEELLIEQPNSAPLVEDNIFERLYAAPFVDISDWFPRWLSKKIREIETMYGGRDFNLVKIRIFRGEWNNRIVYLIMNNLDACGFCEVYYGDGEHIVWSVDYPASSNSFHSTSKNWILIYEFGGGIFF